MSESSNSESLSLLTYDDCEWKELMLIVGIFAPWPLGESRPCELDFPDFCRKHGLLFMKLFPVLPVWGDGETAVGLLSRDSSPESLESVLQRTSIEDAVRMRWKEVFISGLEGCSSRWISAGAEYLKQSKDGKATSSCALTTENLPIVFAGILLCISACFSQELGSAESPLGHLFFSSSSIITAFAFSFPLQASFLSARFDDERATYKKKKKQNDSLASVARTLKTFVLITANNDLH